MGLNKKNGNMYDFVNKKPNPLAGECSHKCEYCYVKKMKARYPKLKEKYSGKPRIYPTVLSTNYKESDFVFVCDCNDLFANDVPDELIFEILSSYIKSPAQLFFQTKNPERLVNDFIHYIPKNSIICTTIETNRFYPQMGNTPMPNDRAIAMSRLQGLGFMLQVTIEPIMDFDLFSMVDLIRGCKASQVNIGADSGRNNLTEPDKDKILSLIEMIQEFTTVKKKKNLARLLA